MRTLLSVLVGVVVTVVLFTALLVLASSVGAFGIGTVELALMALVSLVAGIGTVVWAGKRDARYRPTHSARAS